MPSGQTGPGRSTKHRTHDSHRAPTPDEADIRFTNAPTATTVGAFSAETPNRLRLFGGGTVLTDGLIDGAVDTVDITVTPGTLGRDLLLFSDAYGKSSG